MAEAIQSGFGKVRRGVGGRGWRIDCRPHGWIYSLHGHPFKSKADAEKILTHIRLDVARGRDPSDVVAEYQSLRGASALLYHHFRTYLDRQQKREERGDLSPNTLRETRRYLRLDDSEKPDGHIAGFWAHRTLHEITAGNVDDFDDWLAERGLSPKTRKNVLGVLRHFCRWLRRRGLVDDVPDFPEIPQDEYVPTIISIETQDAILGEIPEDRRGAFLAARLGLRPGEVRALNVEDWHRHQGLLSVHRSAKGPNANAPIRGTKSRRARFVEVDPELRAWLEEHVPPAVQLQGGRPLFRNPTARNRERRWIANALREEWNRAARQLGLSGIRMYEGTKHSSATDALRRGHSLADVQHALGHADARSTERYAKFVRIAPVSIMRPSCVPVVYGPDGGKRPREIPEELRGVAEALWRGGRDSNRSAPLAA